MSTYYAGYKNIRALVDKCIDEPNAYDKLTKATEKCRVSLLEQKTVAESLISGHNRAPKVDEKKAEEAKAAVVRP